MRKCWKDRKSRPGASPTITVGWPTRMGCHFLDTAPIWTPSDLDGIHFEVGEHRKLAEAVADKVREILG